MKYPCCIIQDLLPLYKDGVCEKESAGIIKEHLSECAVCGEKYTALCGNDAIGELPRSKEAELKKAASFQKVRKKLLIRQVMTALASVVLLTAAVLAAVGILKSTVRVIPFADNISVSMTDGSLIARLRGDMAEKVSIKRVETGDNGDTSACLFFCISSVKWNELATSDNVFSEYVLCPADKGVGEIDKVYYYIGDYTGIENMSARELREITSSSELLWSR